MKAYQITQLNNYKSVHEQVKQGNKLRVCMCVLWLFPSFVTALLGVLYNTHNLPVKYEDPPKIPREFLDLSHVTGYVIN